MSGRRERRAREAALMCATFASFVNLAVPAEARPIRYGAPMSVSHGFPRSDIHHHPSGRPGGEYRGGGYRNNYPSRVGNWNRDYDRHGPDRPSPPPRYRGDGGRYYGYGNYYGGGWDNGYRYRHDRYWHDDDDNGFWDFLGTAAVVSAGIALIGAATDSPPTGTCEDRNVNGYAYLQCDDRWYVRVNESGGVKYQQVRPPY